MIVYRITKSSHASDISGTGASLYPGRWNKKGTAVLYTSERIEIALLETIVHIPPLLCPQLDLLTIKIPDEHVVVVTIPELPRNWYHYPAPDLLAEIGQQWVDQGKSLAFKVPSCVVHTSNNFILNCNHKDYAQVTVLEKKEFYFDKRLMRASQ